MWERIKEYFKEQSRTEKKKLREMTFKEKAEYIWEYYRFQIIAAVVVIAVAGSIIHGILNPPIPSFAGVALFEVYFGETFEKEFERITAEALIEDRELEAVYTHSFLSGGDPSTEMINVQKLMAMVSTNELDLLIAENEMFLSFIEEDFLMPLSDAGIVLNEGALVYGENEAGESAAYGVNLKDSALFYDLNVIGEKISAGIIVNSTRAENAARLLEFMAAE